MFERYLSPEDIEEISDAVLQVTGYPRDIRTVFLSDISFKFRGLLFDAALQKVQLDLDLDKFNRTERLTNGSIPFLSWLNRAEQYLQTNPDAHAIIQRAQDIIGARSGQAKPVTAAASPSIGDIQKIVKEKIILQNDLLSYSFLEAGLRAGKSVIKVIVPRYDNGNPTKLGSGDQVYYTGTGWLLTKDLLITNHHVLNARVDGEPNASQQDLDLQCSNSKAEFDFNDDNVVPLTIPVKNLLVYNEDLDFVVLRLDRAMTDRVAPARFPQEIVLGHLQQGPPAVNIIQHPFGHAKKIAIRNNHIYQTDYPKVFYFTDTDKGSSGSPVFNDRWQVIALHRASKPVTDIPYQGKTTGWVNEGVQLKAIFDLLRTDHEAISIEIMNG